MLIACGMPLLKIHNTPVGVAVTFIAHLTLSTYTLSLFCFIYGCCCSDTPSLRSWQVAYMRTVC